MHTLRSAAAVKTSFSSAANTSTLRLTKQSWSESHSLSSEIASITIGREWYSPVLCAAAAWASASAPCLQVPHDGSASMKASVPSRCACGPIIMEGFNTTLAPLVTRVLLGVRRADPPFASDASDLVALLSIEFGDTSLPRTGVEEVVPAPRISLLVFFLPTEPIAVEAMPTVEAAHVAAAAFRAGKVGAKETLDGEGSSS
mmetsp:Transcript_2413/g.7002  ORF Transcript_2413/g.7002 Transcript_2413/m.7002 type:complete len:201 (-) Transcript_2413:1254-1856(-)